VRKAILGKKIGMTQIFSDEGHAIPVTVVKAGPCVVVQKRSLEKDGYSAICVGFEDMKVTRANKAQKGYFGKLPLKRFVREFRLDDAEQYQVGQEIKADVFQPGDIVDVTGTSKGKGFAGGIKRWNFKRGPMAHGSKYHRGPGSLQSRDASRVFKGRKLPGRLGGERVTTQALKVVGVDAERDVILIRGSIPGPKGSLVAIKSSVKAK